MARGVYLDVFDDTIVRRAKLDDYTAAVARVSSITRRTILASAMMGVQVKIPEQWICSSPTAHLSLTPILRSYLEHRTRNPNSAVEPPVLIPFFMREGGHSFARAMDYRLQNSRIQLHRAFSAEFRDGRRETTGRLDLAAAVMRDWANGDVDMDRLTVRLEEAAVPNELAANLGLIAKYLDLPGTSTHVDLSVVNHWLSKAHQNVANRLAGGALREEYPNIVGGLDELLSSAKSYGIASSNFVGLWKHSERNFSEEVTSAIVHTMRSGMHSGIAAWTDSEKSTTAAHIIQETRTPHFDEAFSRTVSAEENERFVAIADDFIEWSSSETEPTDREWNEIFLALWDLKADPKYDETLIKTKRAVKKYGVSDDHIFPLLKLLKKQLNSLRVGVENGRFTVGNVTRALSAPVGMASVSIAEPTTAAIQFCIGMTMNMVALATDGQKPKGVAQINRITKSLKARAKRPGSR